MRRPPKICHIITTWYERAGTSRRTLRVLRGLLSKGYEVDLWVGQEASPKFLRQVQQEGFGVWQVPGLQKQVSPPNDLRALWHMRRRLARGGYDLVHTHLAKAGILGRLAAKQVGVPCIVHTIHGPSFPESKPWWQRALYRKLECLAAGFSHRLVYVGKELQDQYLEAGIGYREKSIVIYSGRDFSKFLSAAALGTKDRLAHRAKMGFKETDLVVGYVARVVPSKGHFILLEAARRLSGAYPHVHFLCVGEAHTPFEKTFKNILLEKMRQFDLVDKVRLLGHQDNIENYYALFDVFIMPSFYEGLPNVVLEAAVMGLPVVAFDCGGVQEILGDRTEVVPPRDLEGFYRLLEKTLAQVQANGHSQPSTDHIKSLLDLWSIENMVKAKHELYEALLGHLCAR
ncbi:MAG: glycosyltransferase family 4 protein [Syntrophobacterales bacterium]